MSEDDDVEATKPLDRPRGLLLVAVAIGALEALMLVAYAVSIAVFELVGTTSGIAGRTELAAPILIVLIAVFGLLIGIVTRLVWQRRSAARTPFLLTQALGVVAAQTLTDGTDGWVRTLGYAILLLAVVAFVCLIARSRDLDR